MYEPTFNSEKFRALILYISERSRDDRWFGACATYQRNRR